MLLMIIPAVSSGNTGAHAAEISPGPAVPDIPGLTSKELAFLKDHTVIRVAFDGNFPPYSFLNDTGMFTGYAVDIVRLIAARTGMRIEIYPDSLWKNLYEAAKRKEVDVVATMVDRHERHKWFRFTRPYIHKSLVVMTSETGTKISRREDIAGRSIALVKGYQYVPRILEEFPGIKPVFVDTMLDALNAVATGRADGAITFIGAGYYLKTKYLLDNLRFSAIYDRDSSQESLAVRNDWPELVSILDKALDSMDKEEINRLNKKWSSNKFILPGILARQLISKKSMIAIISVFTFLLVTLGLVTLWNRSLKSQVRHKTENLQQELEERKKAEMALTASHQYNRLLFESSPVGLALCNMDGKLIDVNPAFAAITGRGIEETLKLTYWQITPEKYAAQEQDQLSQLTTAGRFGPYEKEYIHKDGHLVPVRLNGLIIQRDGEDFIWSSVEDITERRQTENELQNHRQHLEDLVQERTAGLAAKTDDLQKSRQAMQYLLEDVNETKKELEAANTKLKELDRLKSMFIASMSHELRTPLNSIIGFTGITLQGLSGDLNEEQQDNLTRAKRAATHLLELITDVIDISKIETGRIDVFPADFSLTDLITETIEAVTPQATEKGLYIRVEHGGDIIMHTDRKRLLQCLLNLLSNAVKYTITGGVTVAAKILKGAQDMPPSRADHPEIPEDQTGTDIPAQGMDIVEIAVSDTGIGIAQKDMPRLFDAFERIQSQLHVKAGGTGLGLYLTKKISTELLGGTIKAESSEGKGSRFTIRIPKDI